VSGLNEELTYRAYAAGWSAVKRLPEKQAYGLFDVIAERAWRKRGKGVTQLERNLARVLNHGRPGAPASDEEIREVSRQGMRTYMRYYCDVFRLETWSTERIRSHCAIQSEPILRAHLDSGRGVIMALPHMGNWDHAGAWATTITTDFSTVAERLKPEKLSDRFLSYRESLGMEVLPHTGGKDTFAALLRRLRSGGMVCLVADRDLTAGGIPVDFFGETARMPAGPAALAVSTGAALVPVNLWYDGPNLAGVILPEIPLPESGTRGQKIAALTQAVADAFAAGIAGHPADWHMLQKFWPADLDPARAPAAPAEPAQA
jgi:phosphatidylinositol dimannoside acyltransferase